jgi:hypothetical protein
MNYLLEVLPDLYLKAMATISHPSSRHFRRRGRPSPAMQSLHA